MYFSLNIFEILIPHCSKTAWIVPFVVMNFLEIFFIQTQISWLYGHLKVEFCLKTPKSMMRFDRVPSIFLNISGSLYVTNDLNFHNQSMFWWISNFWPPLLASEAFEKNIFTYLIWLHLVWGAKIRFFLKIFVNYLEAPGALETFRGHNLAAQLWPLDSWQIC